MQLVLAAGNAADMTQVVLHLCCFRDLCAEDMLGRQQKKQPIPTREGKDRRHQG